jgi:DNA-binding NarL/FixJ family response regulator
MFAPDPVPVRVLLADDDAIARRAMRDAIGGTPGMTVCGEAATAAQAIALVARTYPDVVVVDAELPGPEGPQGAAAVAAAAGLDTAVVVLALEEDDDVALTALRGGAAGYVLRSAPVGAIVRAVRGVADGEAVISRRVMRRIIDELQGRGEHAAGPRPAERRLTPREWEVLRLMAAGVSTRDIAARLDVAVETVRSHVKHVLRKLGAHTRAEAIERVKRRSSLQTATAH